MLRSARRSRRASRTPQGGQELLAKAARDVPVELRAPQDLRDLGKRGVGNQQLATLQHVPDHTPGCRSTAEEETYRTLVSMTARGSRAIEQSAQLATGQTLAPGFLARFLGEAQQSAHVATWPGVHHDADHDIRRDAEFRDPCLRQLGRPHLPADHLGHGGIRRPPVRRWQFARARARPDVSPSRAPGKIRRGAGRRGSSRGRMCRSRDRGPGGSRAGRCRRRS